MRRVPRSFKARIPKGATDGQRLRLRGQGGKGANGGPDGDLYLNIALRPHPLFRASGHDLTSICPSRPGRPCSAPPCRCRRWAGRCS